MNGKMKKIMKKIIAVGLILNLTVGMIHVNTNVVKAESKVTMTWTGCNARTGDYIIGLNMSGAVSEGDVYWNCGAPLTIDGKVVADTNTINYLGGNEGNTDFNIVIQASALESDKSATQDVGGHTVILEAGTKIGNLKVENDIGFYIDGQSITQKQVGTLKAEGLADQPGASRYMMQLKLEGATVAGDIYWEGTKVLVNNVSKSINIDGNNGKSQNQLWYYPGYGDVKEGATTSSEISDTTIEFPKGIHIGNPTTTGTNGIILKKAWKCKINGAEIVEIADNTGSDVVKKDTLTIKATEGGGYQPSLNRWLIWLDTEEATSSNMVASGVKIAIKAGDNEPTSYNLDNGELLTLDNGGKTQWALLLPTEKYSVLPAASDMNLETEYKVTIKSGKINIGEDEVEIKEDSTILFKEQNIQGILSHENKKLLARPTDNNTGTSGLYFVTEENDGLAYASDWNTRPQIISGGISIDGTKATPTARTLIKLTENLYYISFAANETQNLPEIKTGSKVTLDFFARNANESGRIVKFTSTTFVLNDDNSWTVYEKPLLGDANGDKYVDVRDIVHIKKYLENKITAVKDGADANEDGRIDINDLKKIYEFIIEGYIENAGKSNAVYKQGDIPIYIDESSEINLAGYQGPRSSGYNNYTYDPDTTYVYKKNIVGNKTPSGALNTEVVSTSFINAYEMKQYREAGFTSLITESDCSWTKHDIFGLGGGMYANMKYYMLLAMDEGLDVFVTSTAVNAFLNDMDNKESGFTNKADGTNIEITKDLIIEDLTALVEFMNGSNAVTRWGIGDEYLNENYPAEYAERMKKDIKFENFAGIQLSDEVDYTSCKDKYNYVASEMLKIKPDCRFVSSNLTNGNRTSDSSKDKSLEEVVTGFAAITKQFTYDKYPFIQNTKEESLGIGKGRGCKRGENTIMSDWFKYLSDTAKAAKDIDADYGITLQSYGMDNMATGQVWRNPNTAEEMSWQVYTALAYGVKEINYFTYWEHNNQDIDGECMTGSMVRYPDSGEDSTKSVKTELYTLVQNINSEIKKFDHVFTNFDWQASKVLGDNGIFSYIADDNEISDNATFENSQGTALISCMKDSKKNVEGFWIVNAANPSNATNINVKAAFNNATHVVAYIKGDRKIIKLENGIYNSDIAAGEACFVIPVSIS